jgi:hypothetical protein
MSTRYTIRKYVRFAVACPVYYMGSEFLGNGCVRDISLSGWRVEGDCSVYPGMLLTLAVFVQEESKAIRVESAVVRWAREGAFGLQIFKIHADEAERLGRAVKQLVQQQCVLNRIPRAFSTFTPG